MVNECNMISIYKIIKNLSFINYNDYTYIYIKLVQILSEINKGIIIEY